MSSLPLNASAQVTLDASGNGTCSVGPTSFGETWNVSSVGVHVSTNASEAICRIFAGASNSPAYFCDGTTWGSTGDSTSNISTVIAGGSQVFAAWTGGDVGATAYLSVTGTRNV